MFYNRLVIRQSIPLVHGWRISLVHAAAWGRVRSGCSSLGAHSGPRHSSGNSCCQLCGADFCDIIHAFQHCSHLAHIRHSWWSAVWWCYPGYLEPTAVLSLQFIDAIFSNCHMSYVAAAAHARFAFDVEQAFRVAGLGM